jgi:hypothetical protein
VQTRTDGKGELNLNSSLSHTNLQSSNTPLHARLQTISLQPQNPNSKLILPAKLNKSNNPSALNISTNSTNSTISIFSNENRINFNKNNLKSRPNKQDSRCDCDDGDDDADEDDQDDDDYDYDIPENNRPAPCRLKLTDKILEDKIDINNNKKSEMSAQGQSESKETNESFFGDRKSISPTVDSGILSTSSLSSLSYEMNITASKSNLSSSLSTDETASSLLSCPENSSSNLSIGNQESSETNANGSFENLFKQTVNKLVSLCVTIRDLNEKELTMSVKNTNKNKINIKGANIDQKESIHQPIINNLKEKVFYLRNDLHAFISVTLKRIKDDYACFHVDLSIFNKYKSIYRQFKDFFLYYEACLNKLSNIYKWDANVILIANMNVTSEISGSSLVSSESLANASQQPNDFFELMNKIIYLGDLLNELLKFSNESSLFEYNKESSCNPTLTIKSNQQQTLLTNLDKEERSPSTSIHNDYEYEYDNNNCYEMHDKEKRLNDHQSLYENEPGDYCVIEDDLENCEQTNAHDYDTIELASERNNISKNFSTMANLTLKKAEEKIRKEIRVAVATRQTNETLFGSNTTVNSKLDLNRLTMGDQMLLKFYLKHIEDNLNELKVIYDILMQNMNKNDKISLDQEDTYEKINQNHNVQYFEQVTNENANMNDFNTHSSENLINVAHKLSLNGHKLVFICDTLERNLNNSNLKSSLYDISKKLSDSLKAYMLRIKTTNSIHQLNKQNVLFVDSLHSVFNISNQFRQIIIKFYFKSY